MKNILILNGPNMALLGKREPLKYGRTTLVELENNLKNITKSKAHLEFYQSDVEGEIVACIGKTNASAIVINAAAYTHTSIAILDALTAKDIPYIEVHITNVFAREDFRHHSYISKNAIAVISGLGLKGYEYAINYFL